MANNNVANVPYVVDVNALGGTDVIGIQVEVEELCRRLRENAGDFSALILPHLVPETLSRYDLLALARALRGNPHVRFLQATHDVVKGLLQDDSTLEDRNAVQIFLRTVVGTLPHLQYLHLYDFVTDAVALWIGEMFPYTKSLLELNLLNSPMGDLGASALAKGLCKNKSLQKLFLISTDIGDEGCQALASSFGRNHSLRSLIIHGGEITDVGAKYLETSLRQSNYTLEELGIGGSNKVSQSIRQRIKHVLQENRRVRDDFELLEKGHQNIPEYLWNRAIEMRDDKPELLYLVLKSNPCEWVRSQTFRDYFVTDDFQYSTRVSNGDLIAKTSRQLPNQEFTFEIYVDGKCITLDPRVLKTLDDDIKTATVDQMHAFKKRIVEHIDVVLASMTVSSSSSS